MSEESVWSSVTLPPAPSDNDITAGLRALETTVDGWIADHARRFDPFAWTVPEERDIRRKAFTEAGVYLYVADAVGGRAPPKTLVEQTVERANDRRYAHLVRRNPRSFLKYAYPFRYLDAAEELTAGARDAVAAVLDGRTVWAVERVPYRSLDLWHFCVGYGYEDCPLDRDRILRLSVLNRPPDPVGATLTDLYAVTHSLFYYHDFGVGHEPFPEGRAPFDVEAVVVGGILRHLVDDNPDIVLELLIAGVLQRRLPPELIRLVVAWARAKAERQGYVPGPDDGGPEIPAEEFAAWDDEEHEWARNYHTNLVAATATRVVNAAWPDLPGPDAELATDRARFVDLLRLGQLLQTLSTYDLGAAARQVRALAGTEFGAPYDGIYRDCVRYLRRQETANGEYGFWTDEEAVYVARGNDHDAFREEIVDPVTAACTAAVEQAESTTDTAAND